MNPARTTICILLVVTVVPFAAGQSGPVSKLTNKSEQANPLLQKIVTVLDQVLEAQKTFADPNLRVEVQAHVADMLWRYDEPRARRLFHDTLQFAERLADQGILVPQGGGVLPYPARADVIRLILPHDSDLATNLIENRGELTSDLRSRSMPINRERSLLQLQLGIHFARSDSQRAVLALKPLIEIGDFNNLISILGMIQTKDSTAADNLFIQAIAKARLGSVGFEDIRRFATYVFPSFGEGVLRFSPAASNRDPFAPNSGRVAMEQFLELAYEASTRRLDAALSGASGSRLDPRSMVDYAIPKLLLPYFDRYLPDKSAAFRTRLIEAVRHVPPEQQQYLVLTEPGTVEQLLSRAEAIADPRLKDTLVHRAILQATYRDGFERAAALIELISTESARSAARNSLQQRIRDKNSNDAWEALNKGDFDRAELLAPEIPDWRTDGLLIRGLIGQMYRKDRQRAIRMLDRYEQRAAKIEEPTERAMRLMQLASVAATFDLNRGLDEMKRAIGEFNSAGVVPELQRYREDGSGGTGDARATVNIGLSGLLNNWDLQWLGRSDLDNALALIQQFQMKEAVALMQLNACRGAISTLPAGR